MGFGLSAAGRSPSGMRSSLPMLAAQLVTDSLLIDYLRESPKESRLPLYTIDGRGKLAVRLRLSTVFRD